MICIIHFTHIYQFFLIKHQFHFQVIYTFCSIKIVANLTFSTIECTCTAFCSTFRSIISFHFTVPWDFFICATLKITVQICSLNVNFFFILCSVIPSPFSRCPLLLMVVLGFVKIAIQMRNQPVDLETIPEREKETAMDYILGG